MLRHSPGLLSFSFAHCETDFVGYTKDGGEPLHSWCWEMFVKELANGQFVKVFCLSKI